MEHHLVTRKLQIYRKHGDDNFMHNFEYELLERKTKNSTDLKMQVKFFLKKLLDRAKEIGRKKIIFCFNGSSFT